MNNTNEAPGTWSRRFPWWLGLLAVLQLLVYTAVWTILHLPNAIPVSDNGWYRTGTRYARAVAALPIYHAFTDRRHPYWSGLAWLGTVMLASVLYGITIWMLRRRRIVLGIPSLVILTTVLALPLLVLPNLPSSDVYSYALYGRIAAIYHDNPFIARPDHWPKDPLFPYIAWTTTPSVYGPAWILLSFPLTWVSQAFGGMPGVYVLVYKVVALLALLGSMIVVKRILDLRWPERSTWGTLAFAWNPLVLIEFVGSGHNDSVMLLLVLLGLLLALRDRRLWAVALFTLASLVKLSALIILPLYFVYLFRTLQANRFRTLLAQVVLAAGIAVVLYLPFWAGPATLRVLVTAPPLRVMRSGPAAIIEPPIAARTCFAGLAPDAKLSATMQACETQLKDRLRTGSLLMFVLVYGVLLLWPLQRFEDLTDRSSWAFVAYCLLVAISFHSWYLTWMVGLVPFMKRSRWLLLAWSCTIFLDYSRLPIPQRNLVGFIPVLLLALALLVSAARSALTPRTLVTQPEMGH